MQSAYCILFISLYLEEKKCNNKILTFNIFPFVVKGENNHLSFLILRFKKGHHNAII